MQKQASWSSWLLVIEFLHSHYDYIRRTDQVAATCSIAHNGVTGRSVVPAVPGTHLSF